MLYVPKRNSKEKNSCPLELNDWIIFLQNYETEKSVINTQMFSAIMTAFSILFVMYLSTKDYVTGLSSLMYLILLFVFLLPIYLSNKRDNKETKIFTVFTNCIIEEILQGNLGKYQTRNVWLNRRIFFDDMRKKKLKYKDPQETEDFIKSYVKKFIDEYKDLQD